MIAEVMPLSALLKRFKQFRIPEYQRPYVWTTEEVEQLWNDLEGAHKESQKGLDDSNESQKEEERTMHAAGYFLGPMVLVKKRETSGSEIALVIDGQHDPPPIPWTPG